MKNFTVTIRVETDEADDIVEQDIRDLFYEAGGDMPFSFDITEIKEAQ
ncbi:hypothetical protein [Streptomyces antibioticus]|uniref:Uncharacterized protein n=1 Tax=Streptomyces antibioticus TaxID=1890 RepID=A0AAE6YDY3_STRAT|nr:hypothetical protein [Streptomyces antibioticus]QIT47667.1 hypothetical protein HCX60_32455 [Streptomyces antibioticus]